MPRRPAKSDAGQLVFEPVFYTPTITARLPDGSVVARAGKPVVLNGDDEIGTLEAARMLGVARNTVYHYINDGTIAQADWRQIGEGKSYFIKRAAILRLREGNATEARR